MFKGQPKGLFALALANTGERFGYYTMLAIFTLYMRAKFGWDENQAGHVYAIFLAGVYFMPLIGGFVADKIGYGKCVTSGLAVMFLGYLALAVPMATANVDKLTMFAGLALIAIGTGLFKGNLQVMVGNLYDDPKYSDKRDAAFSLFYMAINIGSMFAPAMAKALYMPHLESMGFNEFVPVADAVAKFGDHSADYLAALGEGYRLCFYVACGSLVLSGLIYFICRPWFKHADVNVKQAKLQAAPVQELTPKQTKDRIVALLLVFAVVIFFWMAFHQNGSALTFFADKYTKINGVSGSTRVWFNIWSLALVAVSIYTLFAIFQSEKRKSRIIALIATLALWAGAVALYLGMDSSINVTSSDFQQFNPFFVVALTPVSVAVFAGLGKKGKEPSAPMKIGLGMFMAAVGFGVITIASTGLTSPKDLGDAAQSVLDPHWLIGTYFTLTIAELLLSPMGISFVSKVAPPKYKGLMMGGWFAATAIGNYLSRIPSMLWNKIPLMANWAILIGLCVVSGLIMLILRKKLEAATAE